MGEFGTPILSKVKCVEVIAMLVKLFSHFFLKEIIGEAMNVQHSLFGGLSSFFSNQCGNNFPIIIIGKVQGQLLITIP